MPFKISLDRFCVVALLVVVATYSCAATSWTAAFFHHSQRCSIEVEVHLDPDENGDMSSKTMSCTRLAAAVTDTYLTRFSCFQDERALIVKADVRYLIHFQFFTYTGMCHPV